MSESITAAAEKRIQELEEILVDVETKSAQTLKEKRRIVKLQKQVKELSGTLAAAEKAMAKERSKQEQLIADVRAAQERSAALEADLLAAEQALANAQVQLAAEQEAKALLEKSLEEADLRVATLQQELEQVTEKAELSERALKVSAEIEAHLAEVQSDSAGSLTSKPDAGKGPCGEHRAVRRLDGQATASRRSDPRHGPGRGAG